MYQVCSCCNNSVVYRKVIITFVFITIRFTYNILYIKIFQVEKNNYVFIPFKILDRVFYTFIKNKIQYEEWWIYYIWRTMYWEESTILSWSNEKYISHFNIFFPDYFPSYIEPLVTQSMQWCDTYSEPLFIPMTSWLPSPYLPLVASLDCVDGANLIAPLRNNQHILCSYGLLDIAMYHVPSKKLLKLFSGNYHCR